MFKKIDHVELVPTDINRTIEFYVSVLGFRIRERLPIPMPPMADGGREITTSRNRGY